MKRILTGGAFLAFTLSPLLAQDEGAPPPPPDQMAPGDEQQPDQGPEGPDQAPDQGAPDAQQGADASFQTFYDNLSNQGTWIQTDNYGYAFQPNVNDPNWAPYTDGSWAYTEDGWTWVSDEPWGWATYHYGRWVNIDGTGWVWIPGYRWAPAWVSWRFGGGYCGWAPLPPETFAGVEFGGGRFGGYHFGGDVDATFHIGPGYYNFVPVGRMGDPNLRGVILNRNRNFAVINHTTNITNLNFGAGGRGRGRFGNVVANGPSLASVNAQSARPVRTMRLTSVNTPGVASARGNSLAVYAPRVNAATARQARPAGVSRSISHANFNRGDSISRPLQVNSRVHGAAPTQAEIQQATAAQAHASASARVASPNTSARHFSAQSPAAENRGAAANRNSGMPAPEGNYSGLNRTQRQAEVHSNAVQDRAVRNETVTQRPATAPSFHTQAAPAQSVHEQRPAAQSFHQERPATAQSFRPQSAPVREQRHESFQPRAESHAPAAPQAQARPAAPHVEARAAAPAHPAAPAARGGKPVDQQQH